MRECNWYEHLIFLDSQQSEGDSIRDQDYEVRIEDVPYRGILLNTGYALVARSEYYLLQGVPLRVFPRFFILEPGHAVSHSVRSSSGDS